MGKKDSSRADEVCDLIAQAQPLLEDSKHDLSESLALGYLHQAMCTLVGTAAAEKLLGRRLVVNILTPAHPAVRGLYLLCALQFVLLASVWSLAWPATSTLLPTLLPTLLVSAAVLIAVPILQLTEASRSQDSAASGPWNLCQLLLFFFQYLPVLLTIVVAVTCAIFFAPPTNLPKDQPQNCSITQLNERMASHWCVSSVETLLQQPVHAEHADACTSNRVLLVTLHANCTKRPEFFTELFETTRNATNCTDICLEVRVEVDSTEPTPTLPTPPPTPQPTPTPTPPTPPPTVKVVDIPIWTGSDSLEITRPALPVMRAFLQQALGSLKPNSGAAPALGKRSAFLGDVVDAPENFDASTCWGMYLFYTASEVRWTPKRYQDQIANCPDAIMILFRMDARSDAEPSLHALDDVWIMMKDTATSITVNKNWELLDDNVNALAERIVKASNNPRCDLTPWTRTVPVRAP